GDDTDAIYVVAPYVPVKKLHDLQSTTNWFTADDADNLAISPVFGTVEFDIDVDKSVENFAQIGNGSLTPVDATDYETHGSVEVELYIEDATNITQVDINIGSNG